MDDDPRVNVDPLDDWRSRLANYIAHMPVFDE